MTLDDFPVPDGMYYHRDGRPITTRDEVVELWHAMYSDPESPDYFRVAETVDDGVRVSTVFLALDTTLGFHSPPLTFETMIFGGDHDQDCWRWASEAEARAGHAFVVAGLKVEAENAEPLPPVREHDNVEGNS